MEKYLRITIQIVICTLLIFKTGDSAVKNSNETALLIIDIQNFYFPGGKWELENPEQAGLNAQKLLSKFRKNNNLIVHIRHNSEPGGDIHELVTPIKNEKVISKNSVNCFKDTDLYDYLKNHEIENLVICGMMTHMCVEAAVRAGSDFGFDCTLVQNACATKAIEFNGINVSAENVHASTLNTLSGSYAKVQNTDKFLFSFSM